MAASMTGNVCPLCKVKYYKVIHNVRANDDYDVHRISRFQKQQSKFRSQDGSGMSSAATSNVAPSVSSLGEGTAAAATGSAATDRFGWRGRSRRCAPVQTRRSVYSTGLRSRLPDPSDGRPRRVRDISARFFRNNPASIHRLIPWLNREVEAVLGEEHVHFVVRLILSIIERVDLDSEDFASHLRDFLAERTDHFVHEFVSFARSPLDMMAYDGKVVYDWPTDHPEHLRGGASTSHGEGSSGSISQPSTSDEPGSSAGQDTGLRQRLFEELVCGQGDDNSVQSSPLQFSHSPIIIHGSSSEEELMEEQLEFQESAFPLVQPATPPPTTIMQEIQPLERQPSSVMETVTRDNAVGMATALPSQTSVISMTEEMNVSTDHIELLVNEEEANIYSASNESRTNSSAGGGSNRRSTDKETLKSDSKKRQSQDDIEEGNTAVSSRRKRRRSGGIERSENHGHSSHSSSRFDDLEGSSRRRKDKDNWCRRERTDSTGRNYKRSCSREKTRSSTSEYKSRVDRGKERLESSADECNRIRKRVVKSDRKDWSVDESSDSEYESEQHHHYYHHHQHHHYHHHHKHKKDKHKKKRKQTEYVDRSEKHKRHKVLDGDRCKPLKTARSQLSREDLLQERLAIEEEIAKSKREILKSSLRKERIELLHKNLHGKSLSSGDDRGKTKADEKNKSSSSKKELLERLVELDKGIVTEKKKLLRVMTRLEEHHTD